MQSDIELANETIESIKEITEACEAISQNLIQNNVKASIAISYISESLRRTGEYIADISEVIINNVVNQEI